MLGRIGIGKTKYGVGLESIVSLAVRFVSVNVRNLLHRLKQNA